MSPEEIIGKNIRMYRKTAGMTQQELAKQAGFSSKHLSRIECGRSLISLPLLLHTAKTLHVEPYKLLISDTDRDISMKPGTGNGVESEAFMYLREQTEHFLSALIPSLQNLPRNSASSQESDLPLHCDPASSQHNDNDL